MELTTILDDCIRRLAAGEDQRDILARYPQHARELAPMLGAAMQLASFSKARLSNPQRLRAKMALREALAERAAPRPRFAWSRVWALPLALIFAAAIFVAVSVSAVASSQPGDAVYPLRVAAERAPVLLRFTVASRASAELDVADRRLTDLGSYLMIAGEAEPAALNALLQGDAAAAERGAHLSAKERAEIAARVAAHAAELQVLAETAIDAAAAEQLRTAANRVQGIAAGLGGEGASPTSQPTEVIVPTASAQEGSPTPIATLAGTLPTGDASQTAAPSSAPEPLSTPTPLEVRATPSAHPTRTIPPSRTPGPRPLLTLTAAGPGPTGVPGGGPQVSRTPGVSPSFTPPSTPPRPAGPTAIAASETPVGPGRPTSRPEITREATRSQQPTRAPEPGATPGATHSPRPQPPLTATRVPPRPTAAVPTSIPAGPATPAPPDTPSPVPGQTSAPPDSPSPVPGQTPAPASTAVPPADTETPGPPGRGGPAVPPPKPTTRPGRP